MVDAQTGRALDGLGKELRSTVGKGSIDLVHAKTGDFHVAIAWDGNELGLAGAWDVQQHDGIGAALAHITTGAQFSLLFLAEALAGVRTDEQPIGAGGIRHLFFWQRLHAGEAGIGPEHEDEVEYQQDDERQANAPEGALGRIDLLAAAMWALAGRRARRGATRWALLRAVLAGVAARCRRRSAARGLLLLFWLRSAER